MGTRLNDKQVKALLKRGIPGRTAAGNGLYLRISNEGTGFWALRYSVNGKRREMALGTYPQLSLANASAETAKLKADIKNGTDPIAEKKRPATTKIRTVNDLAADWLANDIERRLKHPQIPRRVYENDLSPIFGELTLDRVSPLDIRGAINRITQSNRPTIANDALMYCKQLFRHGIRLDLIDTNPADSFTVHQAGGLEVSRSRALNLDELETLFRVLREHSTQFTRENYLAIALLVALGVRKGELIAAKWGEFNFDTAIWDIPQERSKTGNAISVPLSTPVIDWLKELHIRAAGSEYVFPSRRVSTRRAYISDDTLNHALGKLFGQKAPRGRRQHKNVLGEAGIEHFTVHDLRRTCRSLLASEGVPGHVAERCLNHKLKGVEGIYDRYDYLKERREALAKISSILLPMVSPNQNVIGFRRRAQR